MTFSDIVSEKNKISTKVRIAVSEKYPHEIWRVSVKNFDSRKRTIGIFACSVFDMEGYAQPFYYNAFTTSETIFSENGAAVICRSQNPYAKFVYKHAFIMSSENPVAFEGYPDNFTGLTGGLCRPLVLEQGGNLSCSLSTVRNRGGILQNKFDLEAGEEKTIYYLIGFCKGEAELCSEKADMLSEAVVVAAGAEQNGLQKYGRLRTDSPDGRVNLLMNFWAEKQIRYCSIGKKAVRDNSQLAVGFLNFDTDSALKTIEECLVHQYSDGHAVLLWYPIADKTMYSDPAFWLIYACCEYIKETGDFAFLDRDYAWLDGGSAPVFGHLKAAAMWYAKEENNGIHGLPKIFRADWNDALNIPDENAESVFMGECVCLAFGELSELSARLGDSAFSFWLAKQREHLAENINRFAWNGDYYVRALTKFGNIGDKDCDGGKFYINVQSFALLADIVPEERKSVLFASIDAAVTEEGVRLCIPPYSSYDERVGRMSGMLPGVYENGGIYNHAGCFKVMADCRAGRNTEAFRSLSAIIPDGKCFVCRGECCFHIFTVLFLQRTAPRFVRSSVSRSW